MSSFSVVPEKLSLFFSEHHCIEIVLTLEVSQVFSLSFLLLLFPLEPCFHMIVSLGNQCVVDQGDRVLSLTRSCPVDLIYSAHFLECQPNFQYNIFEHFHVETSL